jgi:hypothetical protein
MIHYVQLSPCLPTRTCASSSGLSCLALLTETDSVQHRHGNYIDLSQLKPTSILFSGTAALTGKPAVHFGLFIGCDR